MAYLEVKNLNFTYSLSEKKNLNEISFEVKEGDFVLIFGETGSGKSTLLKLLKPEIKPEGILNGNIRIHGNDLYPASKKVLTKEIGYVSQNPDNQVVTDKVWHELAFTLENYGVPQNEMRQRIAEMVSFFGIADWYDKSVHELSGGQKQILNLASVMIAQPKLLILDEPTSQLDPVATESFIAMLKRMNEEFGTTILLSEHRLDEALAKASKCLILKQGNLHYYGSREGMVRMLYEKRDALLKLLPSQTRLPLELCNYCNSFTVLDAKKILFSSDVTIKTYKSNNSDEPNTQKQIILKDCILSMKNVWFRYNREDRDILSDFSFEVRKGDMVSIFGANGQGKSTLLNLMCGLEKPYRGKINVISQKQTNSIPTFKRLISMLPQNPQNLFVKSTVEEELKNIEFHYEEYARKFQLLQVLKQHPYDLSGGQQQLLALAKVIMTRPEILLLDEPTKGVDKIVKKTIASILKELNEQGTTIIIVSHDVEFCAENTKDSYFMFQGAITAKASTKHLLAHNYYYTSTTNKIVRDYYPDIVLEDEVQGECE